jgi:phosphoenolpyruvate carboxylase
LVQLYSKDITPDDKQELDEALQREVLIANLTVHLMISTI